MKLVKSFLAAGLLAVCVQTLQLHAAESPAQALAREALEKKMQELDPVTTPATPPSAAPATRPVKATPPPPAPIPNAQRPPATVAPVTAAPTPVQSTLPPQPRAASQPAGLVTPSVDSPKVAKAREALEKKMNELGPATPAEAAPLALEPVNKEDKSLLKFPPIAGPPSPLSGDKQQRLAELLRRYQADEISPQQYHAERSKLVAEP